MSLLGILLWPISFCLGLIQGFCNGFLNGFMGGYRWGSMSQATAPIDWEAAERDWPLPPQDLLDDLSRDEASI